jgi:hypothetical protein
MRRFAFEDVRPSATVAATPTEPLIVDKKGARVLLGNISQHTLDRIVDAGQLSVVRLPGGRDRRGYGTGQPSRRVFFSVEEIRRLIARSSERQAPAATVLTMPRRRSA